MKQELKEHEEKSPKSVFSLLRPYRKAVVLLASLSVIASGLGLIIPKFIAKAIDSYVRNDFIVSRFATEFFILNFVIYVVTYVQNIVQVYTSERVAKDVRNTLAEKISEQSYAFVERVTPAKLLTNLTSDIDAIKTFIGQAIASVISAIVIVIGASILLLTINWKLALAVLAIVPLIAFIFFYIFSSVKELMKESREVIDWLNKVINESVLGASLVRVLNSQKRELDKFIEANVKAREVSLHIIGKFATLIPVIMFIANIAVLIILVLGGYFVIGKTMSLGDFTAFMSYISLLIFPIIIIGVMGNMISQAQASYNRIQEILDAPEDMPQGTIKKELVGNIEFKQVDIQYGEKRALKQVSFTIAPRSKVAIIGPTAAGKTQIIHTLIQLISPTSGEIRIDGVAIGGYDPESLHKQVGFVFQDSIILNLTLRENINFGGNATEDELQKAIDTAELGDLITTLPEGLDTVVSERGSSLSGGQKQRIMLARALSLNPKILLLDDFTARVDNKTEAKILSNLTRNYPDVTLVSVTQKIASIEQYDQIILLMEGEVVATGTHAALLATSPEYVQICESQKSTSQYE